MQLQLQIEPNDIEAARNIVVKMTTSKVVQERLAYNVAGKPPIASEEDIWHAMMTCLLTSQQNSDEDGPIGKILYQEPFPLSLDACKDDCKNVVFAHLDKTRGVRFASRISSLAEGNLEKLVNGEWKNLRRMEEKLRAQISQVAQPHHYLLERQAARYMDETFGGFGPKQSRNFWQMLGLTRYEFVLDSRFMNWLHQLGRTFVIPGGALASEEFYAWLSDILRTELCVPAKILPCLLDGAVFELKQPKRNRTSQ